MKFGDFYGSRLKAARKRLGKSVLAFAEEAGVSRSTQMNYESGISLPSIAYLDRCVRMGMNVWEVLDPGSERSRDLDLSVRGDVPVQLHAALEEHLPSIRAGGSTAPLFSDLLAVFRAQA
jgi:transcriptional regulator with XRE-family HTH domain